MHPVQAEEWILKNEAAPKPWLEFVGKQWLTLEESAAYAGIEINTIVAVCKAGLVRAIDSKGQDVGPGRRNGAWRVCRASLDAWGAKA
jgi:hypothetical protein